MSQSAGAADARFAADRMLGRLARWLRLLGADVSFDPSLGGGALLRRARSEHRITLTRDKRLRTAPDALFIASGAVREQLAQVLRRFPFDTESFAFTRCSICNEPLRELEPALAEHRVPPFVFASHRRFGLCARCGRVYWEATHVARARQELAKLRQGATLEDGG